MNSLQEALALKARFEQYLKEQKLEGKLPFSEEELAFLGFPIKEKVDGVKEVIKFIPVKELPPGNVYEPIVIKPLSYCEPPLPWINPFTWQTICWN